MRSPGEAHEPPASLPVTGLEVEETRDEDTIRRFMRDWRKRVIREYLNSVLDSPDDRPGHEPAPKGPLA
jgi:hypothetical protein